MPILDSTKPWACCCCKRLQFPPHPPPKLSANARMNHGILGGFFFRCWDPFDVPPPSMRGVVLLSLPFARVRWNPRVSLFTQKKKSIVAPAAAVSGRIRARTRVRPRALFAVSQHAPFVQNFRKYPLPTIRSTNRHLHKHCNIYIQKEAIPVFALIQ